MPCDKEDLAILILAAGASSRMGRTKQLLPWGNTHLLGHVIERLKSLSASIYCVLGANHERIEEQLQTFPVRVIHNENWGKGLSESIRCGLAYLSGEKTLSSVLIVLADQPDIPDDLFSKIKEQHVRNGEVVIATAYENGPGVPALFPRQYWDDLQSLTGDKGARQWLMTNSDKLILVRPAYEIQDIDTIEDYEELLRKKENHDTNSES